MTRLALLFVFALVLSVGAGSAKAEPVKLPFNGINLIGNHIVAEGNKPSDHTLLLLHGTLAHLGMETIKGLQNTLTERGLNTLSINLSFSIDSRTGMYDCKAPHRHRYEDALEELTHWLDWLDQKGVGTVSLLGHSRGGGQAALFAALKGHKLINRLILLAPATWSEEKAAAGFEKTHGQPLSEALKKARALATSGKESEMIKGIGLLYCPGADATVTSFLSYYEPNPHFDTPTLLPKIDKPILVVAGDADTVVPDVIKKVTLIADGKAVRLVVVKEADHFFLDLFSEDVADAIEEFLGSN